MPATLQCWGLGQEKARPPFGRRVQFNASHFASMAIEAGVQEQNATLLASGAGSGAKKSAVVCVSSHNPNGGSRY